MLILQPEYVYNRKKKIKTSDIDFYGKKIPTREFSKDQKTDSDLALLGLSYVASPSMLEDLDDYSDLKHDESHTEDVLTIAEEFDLDVKLDKDRKKVDKAQKQTHEQQDEVDYKLRLSEHIPKDCQGIVVVAVGANNTISGARKQYRQLIEWNRQNPDKKMGMIFFDYRGAGLSDDVAQDKNNDQELVNDAKAVIEYASSLGKPLSLYGICFGNGPLTMAASQLSQECSSAQEFEQKYKIKGILRSLEYSTFGSVKRRQKEAMSYASDFVFNIFGAPYRSAETVSLSNVHDTAHIPSNIPISTYQALRPSWVAEAAHGIERVFTQLADHVFKHLFLREASDGMMGQEQALKNWGVRQGRNPGLFLISPTSSHGDGIMSDFERKMDAISDMFSYDCGHNPNYEGKINTSRVSVEVLKKHDKATFDEQRKKLMAMPLYKDIVNYLNGDANFLENKDVSVLNLDVLRQMFKERIPNHDYDDNMIQSFIGGIIDKDQMFKRNLSKHFPGINDKRELLTLEEVKEKTESFEKYNNDILGKAIRYYEFQNLEHDNPLYTIIAEEFDKINEEDEWHKIYLELKEKQEKCDFIVEILESLSNKDITFHDMIQKYSALANLIGSTNDIRERLGKMSQAHMTEDDEQILGSLMSEAAHFVEENDNFYHREFYQNQSQIIQNKRVVKYVEERQFERELERLEIEFSLEQGIDSETLKEETKRGIGYYDRLYALKSKLNPEKYVSPEQYLCDNIKKLINVLKDDEGKFPEIDTKAHPELEPLNTIFTKIQSNEIELDNLTQDQIRDIIKSLRYIDVDKLGEQVEEFEVVNQNNIHAFIESLHSALNEKNNYPIQLKDLPVERKGLAHCKKILQCNIEYAVAGQIFLENQSIVTAKALQKHLEKFSPKDIKLEINIEDVTRRLNELKDIQGVIDKERSLNQKVINAFHQRPTEQPSEEEVEDFNRKLDFLRNCTQKGGVSFTESDLVILLDNTLTSSLGTLSYEDSYQIDYSKQTPEKSFLTKVTSCEYMGKKIDKWTDRVRKEENQVVTK